MDCLTKLFPELKFHIFPFEVDDGVCVLTGVGFKKISELNRIVFLSQERTDGEVDETERIVKKVM